MIDSTDTDTDHDQSIEAWAEVMRGLEEIETTFPHGWQIIEMAVDAAEKYDCEVKDLLFHYKWWLRDWPFQHAKTCRDDNCCEPFCIDLRETFGPANKDAR